MPRLFSQRINNRPITHRHYDSTFSNLRLSIIHSNVSGAFGGYEKIKVSLTSIKMCVSRSFQEVWVCGYFRILGYRCFLDMFVVEDYMVDNLKCPLTMWQRMGLL